MYAPSKSTVSCTVTNITLSLSEKKDNSTNELL